MSNAVSALNGAVYQGFATISDMGPSGMLTLRANLSSAKVKKAVKSVTGADMPGITRAEFAGDTGVCWMSPDEVLILCDYAKAGNLVAKLESALAGTHHLVVNVSDARARISVTGTDAREVIAKLSPADVSALQPGQMRRSRLAQVPTAFWMSGEDVIEIICFRSVAQYVFDILKSAALPGSEVGFFADRN